jgi:cellulose synthase/poly-beta-1,6-N-acetylglucosamine synthase-like glycosyltransferase
VVTPKAPDEVVALAQERAAARSRRDWAVADDLRSRIEAAGWSVVDHGAEFDLRPAHPPDIVERGTTRYGSSASVPSRLQEPATVAATVVLVATDWLADVERAVRALRAGSGDTLQVIVVADGVRASDDSVLEALEGLGVEVVRTSERLGQATAWNIGLRRSIGEVVVFLDPSVEATGNLVAPLVAALEDPTVAVAGGWGVVSRDLRRFAEAPAGQVDAIEGYCLAFRRADGAFHGPLDEHFRFYRNLDLWWSLVLRDAGEGSRPRSAMAVELPAMRHEHRAWSATDPAERDRLSKRNFYRLLDRFRGRLDLVGSGARHESA